MTRQRPGFRQSGLGGRRYRPCASVHQQRRLGASAAVSVGTMHPLSAAALRWALWPARGRCGYAHSSTGAKGSAVEGLAQTSSDPGTLARLGARNASETSARWRGTVSIRSAAAVAAGSGHGRAVAGSAPLRLRAGIPRFGPLCRRFPAPPTPTASSTAPTLPAEKPWGVACRRIRIDGYLCWELATSRLS